MATKFLFILLLPLSLFLNSCGSGSSSSVSDTIDSVDETFPLNEKEFLHNLFWG